MSRLSREEIEDLQSPESWTGADEAIQPSARPARAVVSVSFSREDFETIVNYARQHGMKTSEFIRRAALEKTTPDRGASFIISVTGAVQTEHVSVSTPRAKTEVSTSPEPSVYATA